MVWQVDGLSQQYLWFAYAQEWLRDLVDASAEAGSLVIPMWDMGSGYGVDVLFSIVPMFLNPLYFLGLLTPLSWSEAVFHLGIILTIFMAGPAFSLWCLHWNTSRGATLVASVGYVFAGNVLVMYVQPSFVIMLAVFPLILWTADRIFEHKSVVPFVLCMTWLFAYSYYDAYMVCIMLLLYCLAVYFGKYGVLEKRRMLALSKWFLLFIVCLVITILMSMFLFLPQLRGVLGMERLSVEREIDLLYSGTWYIRFIAGFASHAWLGADAWSGFNAVLPLILVALFAFWRKNRMLLAIVIGTTIMMTLPVFGQIMNGFQYPADRWVYGYDAVMAFATARLLPELSQLTSRQRIIGVVLGALYVLYCVSLFFSGWLVIYLIAAIFVFLFAVYIKWFAKPECLLGVAALFMVVSCGFSGAGFLLPIGDNQMAVEIKSGHLLSDHLSEGVSGIVEKAVLNGTFDTNQRYDTTIIKGFEVQNTGLITDYMSPNFYNSMYSSNVARFHSLMGLQTTAFRYASLNSRTMLSTLMGVKYYAVPSHETSALPAFYDARNPLASQTLEHGVEYGLYQTDKSLPLAYFYRQAITEDEFVKIPIEKREMALMQSAVLADKEVIAECGLTAASQLELNSKELAWEYAQIEGCEITDTGIVVGKGGGSITLSYRVPANSEVSICFIDPVYADERKNLSIDSEADNSLFQRGKQWLLHHMRREHGVIGVGVVSRNRYDITDIDNELQEQFIGYADWLYNAGYFAEESSQTVTILFDKEGFVIFDRLLITAVPMDKFDGWYEELAQNAVPDITFDTNTITCSVNAQKAGLLYLPVAYDDGWTATVDGKEASLVKANIAFMGVPLEAGSHEVVLTFCTPWFTEGLILSAAGLVFFLVFCVIVPRITHNSEYTRKNIQ
ncbi:MAG: YfhO family protein [Coriobacteriales bacterium]|nr:YfhO family protein [Coriobacteriales bacterium]